MKPQHLFFLALATLFTILAAWLFTQERQPGQVGESRLGEPLIANFAMNDVAVIRLSSSQDRLTVRRTADRWTIEQKDGYPSSYNKVSAFLQQVWSSTIAQNVTAGASFYPRLGLVRPGTDGASIEQVGTLVEFLDEEGRELAWLLLGREVASGAAAEPMMMSPASQARHVLTNASGEQVLVVNDAFDAARPDALEWLDASLFSLRNIVSIAVRGADEQGWTVERADGSSDFRLTDQAEDESLDTSKASQLRSFLSFVSFSDVAAARDDEWQPNYDVVLVLENGLQVELELVVPEPANEEGEESSIDVSLADVRVRVSEIRMPEAPTQSQESDGDQAADDDTVDGTEETESAEPSEDEQAAAQAQQVYEQALKEGEALKERQGWVFSVSRGTFEVLLQEREDLIAVPEEEEASAEAADDPSSTVLELGD